MNTKGGGGMRVIHYGQIERKEEVRESAVKEKESAPPLPPNSTITRMHILEGQPYAEAGLL